jgi:hypothetical protein
MGNLLEDGLKMFGKVVAILVGIGVVFYLGTILFEDKDDYVELGENTVEVLEDTGEFVYETVKETAPLVLEVGETVCNIDDIILDEIETSVINFNMKSQISNEALRHITNMANRGNATACEVAILDDMFSDSKNDITMKSKLGISKAMKNIKGCTLIACADEYQVMKYLKDENP